MTPQLLSEKMSRHLSSLAPGFEGHYGYYKFYDDIVSVACHDEVWWIDKVKELQQRNRKSPELVCPAWQVEDVLRNLKEIVETKDFPIEIPILAKISATHVGYLTKKVPSWRYHAAWISQLFIDSNTEYEAYQKIEEYLWTVLK